MQINELKSLIARRGGLAKTNRFNVIFTLPPKITSDDRGRDLSLLCELSAMPGKQITTIEYALYGHHVKIPTGFIQDDVSFSFNVTGDYYVMKIFTDWQNLVISNTTYNLAYDSDFKTDIDIQQLNEADEVTYTTKLRGAYPITVPSIILDSSTESSVQKMSVTFCYNDYIKF